MTFVLGVSSGLFGAAQEGERLQYSSLYAKATYCITKGVQFVQLDLESVSEFKSPNLKEDMKNLDKLGITFGIHSETRAFGVEMAEMDSAIDTDYKFGHERLREVLENSGNLGSKYLLIHSSESEPFLMLEKHMQPSSLVDFFGNPLRDFLEKAENRWLIDTWLMGDERSFIWLELGFPSIKELKTRAEEEVRTYVETLREHPPTEEEKQKMIKDHQERKIIEAKRAFLDQLRSRGMHFGPERFSYYFVAKWMEMNNDSLWVNIVNATVEYFGKLDGKKPKEWLEDKKIKTLSIEDDNFRRLNYLWVPAVSAKYIWGHLNQDKNPGPAKYPDFKPILKKNKMPLVLETPMAHRGTEEWLRFPNPIQMYWLAKQVNEEAGFECIVLAVDLEHMLSIKLDPEKVFDCFPEDGGKFVRVIHAGFPVALSPAHIPIPLGSEQQIYLYKMYYKLWKKGMGKDKIEYYLIFERGGGQDPIQQSILALRKIVEFLEKDIKPEDLINHPDFFGISIGEIASWERQWEAIHEHGRDPLKGLFIAAEEEHGFLGRAAAEKGKTEIWKKEELR